MDNDDITRRMPTREEMKMYNRVGKALDVRRRSEIEQIAAMSDTPNQLVEAMGDFNDSILAEQELNRQVFDALYRYLLSPLDRLSQVKRVKHRLGRGRKDVEKRYAIVQAYRAGVSIKQIASRLACTYANVWRILKDEGELARRKLGG